VVEMGDEIDLRQYVDVIVRRWKLVLVAAVSAALVAAVVSFLMPPVYEAVAGVVIIKAKTELVFEPQFKSLSEDDLAMAGARQAVDTSARREAFAALVKNGAIAVQVLDEISDTLLPEEREANVLVGMVEGGIRKGSDLIEIKVTCNDAAKAARIANTWGSEYEKYVNAIYSDAPESYAQVEHQTTAAKAEYDEAEAALTAFVAENRIDDLNRQIGEKQQIIASLQSGRQTALTTVIDEQMKAQKQIIAAYINAQASNRLLAFNKEQQGKRELLSSYLDAGIRTENAVFNEQVEARLQSLEDYWAVKSKMELLLADAESLRAHTARGGAEAARTNGLAVLLLKAQVFASSVKLPGDLQLQLGNVDGLVLGEGRVADLDALIEILQERLSALDALIRDCSLSMLGNADYQFLSFSMPATDTLSVAIHDKYPDLFRIGDLAELSQEVAADNPLAVAASSRVADLLQLKGMEAAISYTVETEALTEAISELQDTVRGLQADVAQESARRKELIRARDLAWDSYTMLARKTVELDISAQTKGSEVRFAAPAVEPRKPVSPKKMQNTAIAGMLGLMIGLFGAFAIEYFGEPRRQTES